MAPKAPCVVNRCRREKPSTRAPRGMSSLDGDALAALRATRVDHRAAAGRLHPDAEAVRFFPMGDGGLESALHLKPLGLADGEKLEIIADRAVERQRALPSLVLCCCG